MDQSAVSLTLRCIMTHLLTCRPLQRLLLVKLSTCVNKVHPDSPSVFSFKLLFISFDQSYSRSQHVWWVSQVPQVSVQKVNGPWMSVIFILRNNTNIQHTYTNVINKVTFTVQMAAALTHVRWSCQAVGGHLFRNRLLPVVLMQSCAPCCKHLGFFPSIV